MGDVEVGGDSSVKWKVNAGYVRKTAPGGPPQSNSVGKGHHQEGVDEVDANQSFTIYLEVPETVIERDNLATALQAAAQAVAASQAGSGAKVSFLLPIEDQNEDQIRITWNSSQVLGATKPGGRRAKKHSAPGSKREARPRGRSSKTRRR